MLSKYLSYILFLLLIVVLFCCKSNRIFRDPPIIPDRAISEKNLEKTKKVISSQYLVHLERIERFIKELVSYGANYQEYMRNNNLVDCMKALELINSDRKSYLEYRIKYRDKANNYFAIMNPNNIYITDVKSPPYQIGGNDIEISLACDEIQDIIELNFIISKDSNQENSYTYTLAPINFETGSFGDYPEQYNIDSFEVQCRYIKVFLEELVEKRDDYWNFLLNNKMIKLDSTIIKRYANDTIFKQDLDNYFLNDIDIYQDCGEDFFYYPENRLTKSTYSRSLRNDYYRRYSYQVILEFGFNKIKDGTEFNYFLENITISQKYIGERR